VCADVCIGYWWKARGVDNIKVDLVEIWLGKMDRAGRTQELLWTL
jgi:hypothetical protein